MTENDPAGRPRVNVRFVHAFCEDVPATKTFYRDLLGMTLQSDLDAADWGWVVLQSEGCQLMFHRWDDGPLPRPDGWPWQPGDGLGDLPAISLGVDVPPDDYADVVAALRRAGTPSLTPVPTWRQSSYWGWTVLDPAGNTLEVFSVPAVPPEDAAPSWPD